MHQLASLRNSQTVDEAVDELIQIFNQLVDSGNINGNVHTYFSGCCISFEILRKLKAELLSLSNSLFIRATTEEPSLSIHVADFTKSSCRITHLSKDGKWYIFKDGYTDIHLSFLSEN